MRKETQVSYPTLRLVKFFIELQQILLVDSPYVRKDPLLAFLHVFIVHYVLIYMKKKGRTDLTLEYRKKTLAIQLKSPARYDEALLYVKRALQIEEQTLPINPSELATIDHRVGTVYFRQNNYEKALE
ncbi:unnamed protein product, partial [Rotaria sp. Silwood1]